MSPRQSPVHPRALISAFGGGAAIQLLAAVDLVGGAQLLFGLVMRIRAAEAA